MNKALVLVMCDVLVLSAMSLSNGTFSASGLSGGNNMDSKSFTKKEINDAKTERNAHAEELRNARDAAAKAEAQAKKTAEDAKAERNVHAEELRNARDAAAKAEAQAKKTAEEAKAERNAYAEELRNARGAAAKAEAQAKKTAEEAKAERNAHAEELRNAREAVAKAEAQAKNAVDDAEKAKEQLVHIREAEFKKRQRLDRMHDGVGTVWFSIEGSEKLQTYGLSICTNRNEIGDRFLLVNEDCISKITDISCIKIKVGLLKDKTITCSVKKILSLNNSGKKTKMKLLMFEPPKETPSFYLDAQDWRYELEDKDSLRIFRSKKGTFSTLEPTIDAVNKKVIISRINTDPDALGDVLIFAKTGRVAFISEDFSFYNGQRQFCPIGEIIAE